VKPKLKAVSRAECDKTDSEQFGSSSFDMPSLKQVQKAPTKGRGLSGNDSEDIYSRHVFQTLKLRTVYNVSQGEQENLKILLFHQILIYLMILHMFSKPQN
jgi:hypothetical protein